MTVPTPAPLRLKRYLRVAGLLLILFILIAAAVIVTDALSPRHRQPAATQR